MNSGMRALFELDELFDATKKWKPQTLKASFAEEKSRRKMKQRVVEIYLLIQALIAKY